MQIEDRYPIIVEKEIPPDGALDDALAFRKIAKRFRLMADSLRSEQGILEQAWETWGWI